MDLSIDVENKFLQILNKLKTMRAIKSFKFKIEWGHKKDVAKVNRNLAEFKDALNKCLLKTASKPRRAEIRNVISELVKKKNDMDSSSDISLISENDPVNSFSFESDYEIRQGRREPIDSVSREEPKERRNDNKKIPNALFTGSLSTLLSKTKGSLKNRESIDKDANIFLCEYCGKQFLRMSAWKYHLLNVHNQNKKVKCEKCSSWFSSDSKLWSHAKIHENSKFQCEICLKCFFAFKTLESHKLTHREKVHECPPCSKKFETKAGLKSHVKFVHEAKENLKCGHCFVPFRSKIELRNHVKDEHKLRNNGRLPRETEYVCSDSNCGRTFKHPRSLRNHVAVNHRSGKEEFSCDVCRKSFVEKGKLNRHLTCHQEGKFVCDLCSKVFSRRDALKRHVFASHEEAKSFGCKFCDKTFSLKYNRDIHEENVHGGADTNIECEICGRKCKNKTTYAIHKKTHSEKKFSCSFCKKVFNRKANYHSHMKKKHAGISPFQTLLDSVAEGKD